MVAVLFAVDDSWRAGWLAGRRRVVALGSDVAEEDEDQDSDSCTWRTRAESIAVALMGGACVGKYNYYGQRTCRCQGAYIQ